MEGNACMHNNYTKSRQLNKRQILTTAIDCLLSVAVKLQLHLFHMELSYSDVVSTSKSKSIGTLNTLLG